MGNGWTLFALSATPPNTVRLRPTGPAPTDWIAPGYPIRNRPGWGRRIGLGTPPPTNHQRKGEERERERDPHHELAIQFMVCSAQYVPRKEGGVLAIFVFGSFSARLSTACALCTPKRGEVPAVFGLGSFSGRLSTACALCPLKRWEVPAIFVLESFSARLSTACALSTLNRREMPASFGLGLFRRVCRPQVHLLPLFPLPNMFSQGCSGARNETLQTHWWPLQTVRAGAEFGRILI